eukprot:131495-Prymnesium_polylepis.4
MTLMVDDIVTELRTGFAGSHTGTITPAEAQQRADLALIALDSELLDSFDDEWFNSDDHFSLAQALILMTKQQLSVVEPPMLSLLDLDVSILLKLVLEDSGAKQRVPRRISRSKRVGAENKRQHLLEALQALEMDGAGCVVTKLRTIKSGESVEQILDAYADPTVVALSSARAYLPPGISFLGRLTDVDVSGCGLISLPDEICVLSTLKTLDLSGCSMLARLPEK